MSTSKDVTIQRLKKSLEEHFASDLNQFAELHKKLDGLATKEDTEQILQAINVVKTSRVVLNIGWKTFIIVGTIAGIIISITGAWKAVFAYSLIK